ncbi:MAG TPA: RNA polymerase sigma factor, partial [Ktedonobacteraceae bacterium]|nr:RNA polymerase sigma factor [Ktedonobacteraceae bacterium]
MLTSTISSILCHHGQSIDTCAICRQRTHMQLAANIDTLLADARPRLLRLTRMNGIPQDVADDVVQETLMEAWRHLENLHTPERFSAWLDGICRNVCRRQARTQDTLSRQNASLSDLQQDTSSETEDASSFDILDPQAIDPAELLNHEDMATLLDRALAYLPAETRELVELCYLAELPQREVAARLNVTVGALELRLHRARRLLRQVLNGELRAEAEAFGILDVEQSSGWQETRQWCWLCGKQRMRAIFEQQPDGTVNLRVRCPDCSKRYDMDIISTAGL